MTTATTAHEGHTASKPRLPRTAIITDTLIIAKRNLIHLVRTPALIVFATVQPILFVLLFVYVFGGSIHITGMNYVDYLLPGIFVQTVAFGGINTAVGLADDLSNGIIDRFRSLPMSRSAVLAGRTIADAIRTTCVVLLMIVVGVIVGFRFHSGFAPALAAIALAVAFSFALSWVFAYVSLAVKQTETAQLAGMIVIFPLTFSSGAFSQVSEMPTWLQVIARNQPFTHVVDAMRALTQGGPTAHPLTLSLIWIIALTAGFGTLAVRAYRTA